MKKPRCLFYAHDGYGMGHLGRTVALAKCLKQTYPKWDVLVVTGDKNAFQMLPVDVELVKLPSFSITADDENRMKISPTTLSSYALTSVLRKQILNSILAGFTPDVIVVDHLARGLGRELSTSLNNYKKKYPDSRLLIGMRGIMGTTQQIYNEGLTPSDMDYINKLYDKILIYIDKSVLDITSYYKLPTWFNEKMLYTGYVTSSNPKKKADVCGSSNFWTSTREEYLGVGLGSGIDAGNILADILEALSLTDGLPKKKVIVTGPKLAYNSYSEFAKKYPQFNFQRFTPYYSEFVTKAAFFVGLGGYNTISAWLKGSSPALMISRNQTRQKEQQQHLQALADLGLCKTINEQEACVAKLVNELETLVRSKSCKHSIATGGETVVADYVNSLVY